jgi:beta-phosphoglucomutase family hydrolase
VPVRTRAGAGTVPTGMLAGYDALLFDLDGVLTDTAALHAEAWKHVFDPFLAARAAATGERLHPFDIETDYIRFVDGRGRQDGVATFLAARGIDLAVGAPDDEADTPSIRGLARDKDARFLEVLDSRGVQVFPDARLLVETARNAGKRLAVVSASRHCETVLRRAGLLESFDLLMTGCEATELQLRGKPAPDTFLAAASALSVVPAAAVVLEDAITGVEAGRRGAFGLVVGVDRRGDATRLLDAGADLVVADLRALLDR